MNVEIEASDGKIPRKRGRDADIMIHADGISSFEARRINAGLLFFVVVAYAHTSCQVLSRFKLVNSSDNHSSAIHKPQKKNHHSDTKKSQLALPMLSFKTASQQLQKISLASALHSKRKVDAKGIFSNVKSGKYHTNAAPHEFAREDELAVTPVTPPQIHVAKKTERNLDGNGSSDIEEGIPASKGDDEGIFVTRASASYIHALREALGRKILYSAYPKSDGRNKDHQEAGNIVKGVFKDVNNQFCFVTIDEIVYAECSCDDFLVRCSDNAAFSGSTGDFIGYWQNEGFILTD